MSDMRELSAEDAAWLRRVIDGRSPREIVQIKALVDAYCATPPEPALPRAAQSALLDITDALGHLRALILALDMAFSNIQDSDSRHALTTLSDAIFSHLHTIRDDVDALRGADSGGEPVAA